MGMRVHIVAEIMVRHPLAEISAVMFLDFDGFVPRCWLDG